MDQITIDRIKLLHPSIRQEVMNIYVNEVCAALTNSTCRFAYTIRTFDEQTALYNQGRTVLFDKNGKRLGKVINAKAGQSFHNYGLAFDIVLIKDSKASWDTLVDFDKDGKADWMEVVAIFKKHGYVWGGDFKSIKDAPHFEKTFGYNSSQLLAKHTNKDFIPGTNYVKL